MLRSVFGYGRKLSAEGELGAPGTVPHSGTLAVNLSIYINTNIYFTVSYRSTLNSGKLSVSLYSLISLYAGRVIGVSIRPKLFSRRTGSLHFFLACGHFCNTNIVIFPIQNRRATFCQSMGPDDEADVSSRSLTWVRYAERPAE